MTTTTPLAEAEADLTRPIIGVEHRTNQEVFDIMCDRIRSKFKALRSRSQDNGGEG